MKHIGIWSAALCLCAAAASSMTVSAAEAESAYRTAWNSIVYDAQGNACVPDGEGYVAGFVTIEPEFRMGDINGDDTVDAQDAAELLIASAEAGASGRETAAVLADSERFADSGIAQHYADTNEDGLIGSDDAAGILAYSSQAGASQTLSPLGTRTFYADANGVLQTGWFTDPESGRTYYADERYTIQSGWLTADDALYYLGEDGALPPEGWLTLLNSCYYVKADGSIACGEWVDAPEGRFYLDAQGTPAAGLTQIGETVYCFGETGLVSGWFEENGERIYCSPEGIPQTGAQVIDGVTYYFDPATYVMQTGWSESEEGVRYYDASGAMLTGWQEIDSVRCYFGEDGLRAAGLTEIGADSYYFAEDGAMVTGWVPIGKTMHYFGEDGIMYKMWHIIDGHQYCFGGVDGVMLTGWAGIGGKNYYFGTDGIMVTEQTVGDWYLTADGSAISNRLHVNQLRAQEAFAQYGTSVSGIYNYVRSTTRYKKIETTKTLEQIESIGWMYFVDYSMTHYYGVCYYLSSKMDFLLREAGYECRMVHSVHSTGYHYWNQVLIDGTWVNYDCTNALAAKTVDQVVAYGNYQILGYVTPDYQ